MRNRGPLPYGRRSVASSRGSVASSRGSLANSRRSVASSCGSLANSRRSVVSICASIARGRGAIAILFLAGALMACAQGFGQQPFGQQSLDHRIDLPHDSPVSLVGDEWGGSAANVRGGAFVLDVRVSLSLRN